MKKSFITFGPVGCVRTRHYFLGTNLYYGQLMCLPQGHNKWGAPWPSGGVSDFKSRSGVPFLLHSFMSMSETY